MADEEQSDRVIKPQSSLPASREEILDGLPELSFNTSLAADLVGLRRTQFTDFVRDSLGEKIADRATLSQTAKAYAAFRPDDSFLTDSHFTSESALERLQELIEHVERVTSTDRTDPDDFQRNKVYQGSAFDHTETFPADIVQTVVTSPPYWGTRVYPESFGVEWTDGSTTPFGGEETPEQYISHTLEFFLRLRPILKDSATIWWNLGDVYNTRTQIRSDSLERMNAVRDGDEEKWTEKTAKRHSAGHEYLKDKDLTLIPYRLATALERTGFWVRSVIIWRKRNVVPETVADRPTTGHEVILLVSDSKQYKFDEQRWRNSTRVGQRSRSETENLRTVWEFKTAAGKEGHAAPFPLALPGRCITLGTDEGDLVYDPFMGSGTTAVAAKQLNRDYVGSEISDEYIDIIEERVQDVSKRNGGQRTLSEIDDGKY